jgi:hypothetical protein
VDDWRIDDLLRADLYAIGIPEGVDCRNNDFAGPAVDGTDGTERDAGGGRLSLRMTDTLDGFARGKTHLVIDRNTKYCEGFRQILQGAGAKIVLCPPHVSTHAAIGKT